MKTAFIILKPTGRAAMYRYADEIMDENREFALDLVAWARTDEEAADTSTANDMLTVFGGPGEDHDI